jgi:hypothetical protein
MKSPQTQGSSLLFVRWRKRGLTDGVRDDVSFKNECIKIAAQKIEGEADLRAEPVISGAQKFQVGDALQRFGAKRHKLSQKK